MQLPSSHDVKILHQKYAPTPEVLDIVFTHCAIVSDIAAQLIAHHHIPVDAKLVKVGCLLHDIGVYPLFDQTGREHKGLHYITHGVRGEAILRNEGFPEKIWRFASHHTGVGLSRLDIKEQELPLPDQSYQAETLEEELVMYADKFHSKTNPPHFNPYDWYKESLLRFGKDKVAKFEQMAQKFGVPDLDPLIEKYGHTSRT